MDEHLRDTLAALWCTAENLTVMWLSIKVTFLFDLQTSLSCVTSSVQ